MKTISVDDDSAEALLKVLRRAIRREAVEPEELPHVMAVIHALIRSEEEPAHSAACPNATETCSPTCAAWEGQTCNCKVAPSAVDLATVAWTADERAILLEFTKVRRLCDRKGACGPCASWLRVSFSVSDENPSVLAKSIRDRARAILAARGTVAT